MEIPIDHSVGNFQEVTRVTTNPQAAPGRAGPTMASAITPAAMRMFENDRASAALGMHIVALTAGHAVITMRVRGDMLNGFAIAHGGFIFALADTAFAAACNEDERVTVASGAEISYLRPALEGQLLTATAHRRHVSGRNGIYDVQVSNKEEVIAEFRGRSRITSISPPKEMPPPKEVPPPEEGA